AGSTYYLQVGMFVPGPSTYQLRIDPVTAPSNDDFATAAPLSGSPVSVTSDLTAATVEVGEPAPGGSPLTASVWHAYTATTTGTLIVGPDPATVVAVYTGSSLGGLTELASGSGPFSPVHFAAQAGTTYMIQVAKRSFFPGSSSLATITIDVPGPVTAQFSSYPFDPSIYDTVQFVNSSFDTAFIGFASEAWDFGDGVPAAGCCPSHRYAVDGDYAVTLTVTTLDGRTATATQTVSVRTHDVSIERIQAPSSARAGQTKTVGVSVRGGRYAESVQVDLLGSVGGSPDVFIGSRTVAVPAAHGGRTTQFDFQYTFTTADGDTGKVTFKAFATILGARDALPADNAAIAAPTTVKA
ncbi:MAG: hypothetical protein QOI56_284, partial [Actinomycetota bacterium]|nr:hypothetical protein [Actinomycetota bacterium]